MVLNDGFGFVVLALVGLIAFGVRLAWFGVG